MLIKLRFRFPEIFFGVLLTVAIFAMGGLFWSSQNLGFAARNSGSDPAANEAKKSRQSEPAWITSENLLALFTLGLVIVGGIQLRFFFVQLRLIHQTLEPARQAADAAKLNAQAIMDAERAHLFPIIKETNLKDVFKHSEWYGDKKEGSGGPIPLPMVTYRLKNLGKTPAIIEHVAWGMSFHKIDEKFGVFATDSEAHQPLGIVTADQESEEISGSMSSTFTFDDAVAVLSYKGELIFHGQVTFKDFFNRSIRCCWQFRGRRDGFHLYRIDEQPQPQAKS